MQPTLDTDEVAENLSLDVSWDWGKTYFVLLKGHNNKLTPSDSLF